MANKTEMEQIDARLTKLDDFKSDQEALTRIRLKGFLNVLACGRAIDSGDKRFWTMKEDAADLVYSGLEPVKWRDLSPEALAEKTTKVLNEMSACLLERALVGFFPVGRFPVGACSAVIPCTPVGQFGEIIHIFGFDFRESG